MPASLCDHSHNWYPRSVFTNVTILEDYQDTSARFRASQAGRSQGHDLERPCAGYRCPREAAQGYRSAGHGCGRRSDAGTSSERDRAGLERVIGLNRFAEPGFSRMHPRGKVRDL
jgi:hypothetical protein